MKVVTSQEMARLEKSFSVEELMDRAARGIAFHVENLIEEKKLPRKITILAGKGNNGKDALLAGEYLKKRGFDITGNFDSSTILDGLTGTGFHGKAKDTLAETILKANNSHLPIIAIDLPSGLNADSGEGSPIIKADYTLSIGYPKMGLFIGQGWNHVGKLLHIDIGLPDPHEVANLLEPETLSLPTIVRDRNKYDAGYVLAIAGSPGMPGAAMLCTSAILRSGAGIVRHFYPAAMDYELTNSLYEVIREPIDIDRILEEADRADALVVGPGIGRSKATEKYLGKLLARVPLPTIIDGDGLFFKFSKLPPITILTPHKGEAKRLLEDEPTLENCQSYAEEKKVIFVLKGAPTFIFAPGKKPLIVPYGDPGMATAGSGDVLAGMIASLIAQGLEAYDATALAVYLHARAGELAAQELTSYCMIASDLIRFLPKTFARK